MNNLVPATSPEFNAAPVAPEILVAAIHSALTCGKNRQADALFLTLENQVEPTVSRIIAQYAGSAIHAELRDDAHRLLWECVLAYTPAHATRGNCPFGGFLNNRLLKACSETYYAAQASLGESTKSLRKVRKIRGQAADAGVDPRNAQAVFDFAVDQLGERPTILRKHLPLLGGSPASLNAPLPSRSGDKAGDLLHYIQDENASLPGRYDDETPERNRRALAALNHLTDDQRRVVVRHFGLDGKPGATIAAIARVEKKSATAIQERLDRALSRMNKAAIIPFPTSKSSGRVA